MKRWKRSGALILAAVLSLSLSACGGSEPTPEEILDQTLQNSQEGLESLSASVTAQIDMEIQVGDQTQTMETTTAMDMVCFSDPLKLKAETSMDMGELGSFSATVYAQQEGETYTTYTDVGGQWFRETASAELLEQYNASAEMNSYLSSTDQWSGVLDSLGTMQQLGVSTENLQGMLQDLGDVTIEMWIDPEICYPVRYEMDMTQVCNTLMEHVLQVLEDMGQPTDGISIQYPQVQMTMTCSDINSAPDFEIPAEALEA